MRIIPIIFCLLAASAVSAPAAHNVTFFRDGALHRVEASAAKGVVQMPLPADLIEQTLTVVPAPGTTILAVETANNGQGRSGSELDTLTEQRRRLEDRLQALETRETIFTSAAKAQSGKAPRKTKANPDPMQTIRQGTDYAIAQLESVYTARRKTTQEIARIDSRIAAARKNGQTTGQTVRVEVTPPRGKVTLIYGTTELGWQPRYNLRLADGAPAQLQLSAYVTGGRQGQLLRVSPASLSDSPAAESIPARQFGSILLADYRMPVTEELYKDGIFNSYSGKITNTGQGYLPPGEAGLFRNGSYRGKFVFEGLSSGRSRVISLGR